ncbi:hypothetical protein [Anoxynatronum sibiricum]|uniref:Uncharacterized protein n=1 Tax=Anoxynatronum sibiricum TaxID=210623 RepID=A0ABU9VZJ8_9CLOT
MEDKMAQIFEVLENEEGLVERLFMVEEAEEAQAMLKEKGLEISIQELTAFRDILNAYSIKGEGDLTDDELEEVAGGFISSKDWNRLINDGKKRVSEGRLIPGVKLPRVRGW